MNDRPNCFGKFSKHKIEHSDECVACEKFTSCELEDVRVMKINEKNRERVNRRSYDAG